MASACLPAGLFSWGWLLRPGAFGLGALLALRPRVMPAWSLPLWLLLAVLAPVQLPPRLVLGAVAITGGMSLAVCLDRSAQFPGLVSRILVWIGERSYSLYLCHLPMFLLIRALKAPWFCAPLLALAAAHFSFEWVEQKFRRRGQIDARAVRVRAARQNR